MKKFFLNIKSFIIGHKLWSAIIILVVIFFGYRMLNGKAATETRYVTSPVVKGTIVSSVTGSGQVEATSTIDLKPKVSGDVVAINAKAGALARKGQTLFVLDAGDASKSVRDSKLNLEIAENDLQTAKKDYENTRTTEELLLKNSLLVLNSTVTAQPDDDNISTNIVTISGSYTSDAQGQYVLEIYACQKGVCVRYSGLESGSFTVDLNIPKQLGERGLYVTFTGLPKSGEKWYINIPSLNATSYASNKKTYEDALLSVPRAIDAANSNVTTKELALTSRQNALADVEKDLSDYYITAPFDGKVASVAAKLGELASPSATLGTIITNQKLATISLNEVDVAKIALGQKVTLTFDAIEGLSIAGEVAEIDSVGTTTQGVVNYNVKVNFATEDARIKPGMSVTAAIVTAVAQDVLYVPTSAVKTRNGESYVEMFDTPLLPPVSGTTGSPSSTPPRQQTVETGISNDLSTEITSGLKEGDNIVSKTVSGSTVAKTTAQAPSIFGSPQRGGGGTRVTPGR